MTVIKTINSEKKTRNSNIEILRILSMIFIVSYHIKISADLPIINLILKQSISIWGILGVYLFVIISAWFNIESKFNIKHLLIIIIKVLSYILFFLIFFVLKDFRLNNNFSITYFLTFISSTFKSLFNSSLYWFVSSYCMMYVFSPILNFLLFNLKKSQIKIILLISIFIVFITQSNMGLLNDSFNFIYTYFLIGFFKIYKKDYIKKQYKLLPVFFIIMYFVSNLIVYYFGTTPYPLFNKFLNIIQFTIANNNRNSIILLIIALLIFFTISRIKERTNKIINYISSSMFGVYLFHGFVYNNIITGDLITELFIKHNLLDVNNKFFIFQFILLVLFIMVAGVISDIIIQNTIQKPVMKIINRRKKLNNLMIRINNCMNN